MDLQKNGRYQKEQQEGKGFCHSLHEGRYFYQKKELRRKGTKAIPHIQEFTNDSSLWKGG